MKIDTFKVEKWMNKYDKFAAYDIAQTCVNTLSLDELFKLSNKHNDFDKNRFVDEIFKKNLGYGQIQGFEDFRKGICSLYKTVEPENVISTIGAAGANHLVFYSLINSGERVISVIPTYQQLYSIPASFGADVQLLHLRPENNFLPDLNELKSLINDRTKMICLNNPNNPSGSLMDEKMLNEIVDIAREADAYILCDEVYRGLNQNDEVTPSIADLYEKGISTSSMSKVFSLAGLRLGWVASNNKLVIEECLKHREYNMISCGMIDESLAALALNNSEIILKRNKQIIRENLEILDDWVKRQKHITYAKPKAGTTALLYFDFGSGSDMTSEEFCIELIEKTGVYLTPGECFELKKCARIGYAGDKDVLRDGLGRLEEFFNLQSFV